MSENILIVVDVQNCFLNGGSMGNDSLADSIKQIGEVYDLMTQNKYIYLSRDFHPVNHISLESTNEKRVADYQTIFPRHCRNKDSTCPSRITKNILDDPKDILDDPKDKITIVNVTEFGSDSILPKSKIIGTDISYLYFKTDIDKKYKDYQKELTKFITKEGFNTIGLNTIGLKTNKYNINIEPNVDDINWNDINFPETDIKILQLTKGEFCSYESFSAFNYHVNFNYDETKENVIKTELSADKKFSTGLWEHIIKNIIGLAKKINKTIKITVCGLVGNFCVMNTVHHGINMWNNVYKKEYPNVKIIFIYSFYGTLFLKSPDTESRIITDYIPFILDKLSYSNVEDIISIKEEEITYNNKQCKYVGSYKKGILNNFYDDFNKINKTELNNFNENKNIKLYYYAKDNDNLSIFELKKNENKNENNYKLVKVEDNNKIGGSNLSLTQSHKQKYLKYKKKYLQLKQLIN